MRKPNAIINDATAAAPRIVNGLTARPPKKVSPWLLGIAFLPDFAALPVLIGFGMYRLLRYLSGPKREQE